MATATKLIIPKAFEVAYEDIDLGAVGPKGVLVRATLSAISHGTEGTAYTGTSPFIRKKLIFPERVFRPVTPQDPPFYPFRWAGYDTVGVVEAAGSDVTGVKAGGRVWHTTPHQTYALLTEGSSEMHVLGPEASEEDAVMTSLTGVALTAVNDAEVHVGDVVAVFGGGIVGQLAVQIAFLSGARRVFLVEPLPQRRELARKHFPAECVDPGEQLPSLALRQANGGKAPDVVIECSGQVKGLTAAVASCGVGGTVVAAGFYAQGAGDLCLGEEFIHNRITIKASMNVWGCPLRPPFWDRARVIRESAALIESRKLKLDGFCSTRVPFAQAKDAYEMIQKDPGRLEGAFDVLTPVEGAVAAWS